MLFHPIRNPLPPLQGLYQPSSLFLSFVKISLRHAPSVKTRKGCEATRLLSRLNQRLVASICPLLRMHLSIIPLFFIKVRRLNPLIFFVKLLKYSNAFLAFAKLFFFFSRWEEILPRFWSDARQRTREICCKMAAVEKIPLASRRNRATRKLRYSERVTTRVKGVAKGRGRERYGRRDTR